MARIKGFAMLEAFQPPNEYAPVIRLLLEDHRKFKKALERLWKKGQQALRQTSAEPYSHWLEAELQLRKQWEMHCLKEDRLFECLSRYVATQTGPLAVMEFEHQQIVRHLNQFETLISDLMPEQEVDREIKTKIGEHFTKAYVLLKEHMEREEKRGYALAEQCLTNMEKTELYSWMKRMKIQADEGLPAERGEIDADRCHTDG